MSLQTEMDKRSGFWQVDLAAAAQELVAFITPKGVCSNGWSCHLAWLTLVPIPGAHEQSDVQDTTETNRAGAYRAQMETHIDDVCLGSNTKEDHYILLQGFFSVCQEHNVHIKLEKCWFLKEAMEYLGFDVDYGWCTPAASKN